MNPDGFDAFAVRIVEAAGAKRIELAWTQSLRHLRIWLAQVQTMEGGAGSIQQIAGAASAGLEMGILAGRIGPDAISYRLGRSLGGNWTVDITTINGVLNIIALRS